MSLLHGPHEDSGGGIQGQNSDPGRSAAEPRVVKCEFHVHASEDPCDVLDYPATALLDRAAELGFEFLALTLHHTVLHSGDLIQYAGERGILMIPAAELKIGRADVLVFNISDREAKKVRTFDDLRQIREERGESILVMAPHPYFVIGGSMGALLERYSDCFDAVEICHLHTPFLDLNRRAVRVAEWAGLPMLATSDAHELKHFGQHHAKVTLKPGQELNWAALSSAIREGRIENVSPAISPLRLVNELMFLGFRHPFRRLVKRQRLFT